MERRFAIDLSQLGTWLAPFFPHRSTTWDLSRIISAFPTYYWFNKKSRTKRWMKSSSSGTGPLIACPSIKYFNRCLPTPDAYGTHMYWPCGEVRITSHGLCNDQLDMAKIDVDIHASSRRSLAFGQAPALLVLFFSLAVVVRRGCLFFLPSYTLRGYSRLAESLGSVIYRWMWMIQGAHIILYFK